MKTYAFRLRKGADLKKEIIKFSESKEIKAGIILTCVGSLSRATIRLAGARSTKELDEELEIVSLVGTLGNGEVHLHISLSDKQGACIGGHLKENCIVDTTAEIVIGVLDAISFVRRFDDQSGYDELITEAI